MKLSSIKLNPENPRIIKDEKFEKLVNSIRDFPQMMELRPIVVDENNMILGGNMRLRALQQLEMIDIPAKWVKKASELTEEQKKEFIIKDNVGFGEWDWDIIANQWNQEEITDWGLYLPEFLDAQEAEEDDYEIPDEIGTDIVLGDLFEIGEHRLLCGDSTKKEDVEKLMNGEKADMVFTDPPYGISYESNAWDSKKKEVIVKRTDKQIFNDGNTNVGKDALKLMPLFLNNNRHFYVWCRWDCFNDFKEICQEVGKIKSVIVRDKGCPGLGDLKGSYWDSEWSIFGMIGRRELKERQNGVWQVNRMKGLQMQHPTQKPLEICERGINNSTNLKEIILDFFIGSGSTMVAAHQLNRKCYGIEISPQYCQVTINRMKNLDESLIIKKNGKIL